MKQIKKMHGIAAVLSSLLVIGCAATKTSESTGPKQSEQETTGIPKTAYAKVPDCSSGNQAHAAQSRIRVRLFEPPFATPRDPSVLSQEQIREYATEPYVLQYQVIEIDAKEFRDFVKRESAVKNKDCWASVYLTIFDEEPIEVFRDALVVSGLHVASDVSTWAGRSRGTEPFSFQFVIGPDDAVSMSIESKSKIFQVNWTDSLPYHVLWEWDTNFFGPSTE
jgi:hypothetical protein